MAQHATILSQFKEILAKGFDYKNDAHRLMVRDLYAFYLIANCFQREGIMFMNTVKPCKQEPTSNSSRESLS